MWMAGPAYGSAVFAFSVITVGLLKRGGMRQEQEPAVLAMQQALKHTFDPLNLFNPGKVTGTP